MTKRKKIFMFVLIGCFSLVALLVQTDLTRPVESFIYSKIQTVITPVNTMIAKGITYLSDPITVTLLCLILIAVPYTRRRIALPVSASAVCAAGLNWVLKQIFVRERPNILRLVSEGGYSFPSGHSATSAAIGIIFILLIIHFQPRTPSVAIPPLWNTLLSKAKAVGFLKAGELKPPLLLRLHISQPKKYILMTLCYVIPFLIGLSRIYLGVHYAGDVVGGWLMGVLVGNTVYMIWNCCIPKVGGLPQSGV